MSLISEIRYFYKYTFCDWLSGLTDAQAHKKRLKQIVCRHSYALDTYGRNMGFVAGLPYKQCKKCDKTINMFDIDKALDRHLGHR